MELVLCLVLWLILSIGSYNFICYAIYDFKKILVFQIVICFYILSRILG